MRTLILTAIFVVEIHTGQDLLNACAGKDTSACDAFIKQAIRSSPSVEACFGRVARDLIRADVMHKLRMNQRQHNGANLHDATDLVVQLLNTECHSDE